MNEYIQMTLNVRLKLSMFAYMSLSDKIRMLLIGSTFAESCLPCYQRKHLYTTLVYSIVKWTYSTAAQNLAFNFSTRKSHQLLRQAL